MPYMWLEVSLGISQNFAVCHFLFFTIFWIFTGLRETHLCPPWRIHFYQILYGRRRWGWKRKNIISSIHIWMNSDKQKDDCINIYKNCNIFMCNLWVRWQVSHDLHRDTLSFHPVSSQSLFSDPVNVCFPFFVPEDNCHLCNGSILAKFSAFSMCNWQLLTCSELQNWCRCSCRLPLGADTQWFFHD